MIGKLTLDRENWAGLLLALPAKKGMLLFVVVPWAATVVLSFTDLHLGSPQALYDQPDTVFVAGFLGQPGMNL